MRVTAAAAAAAAFALATVASSKPVLHNVASHALDVDTRIQVEPTVDGSNVAKTLEDLRKALNVPGMGVSVVHKGNVILQQGFGVRNEDGDPVTPDTRFRIASMTKAFTSFGVAAMVTEGLLEWTQPVRKYRNVRFSDPVVTEQATLLDIMSHRTGLPRHDILAMTHNTGSDVLEVLEHLPLSRQFREQFQYNNIMFLLAGTIAANASSHDSWERLTQSLILNRLNMTSSSTDYLLPTEAPDFAEGFVMEADSPPKVVGSEQAFVTPSAPAGIISSTANDMVHWMKLMLAKGIAADGTRLVKEKDFDMLVTPRTISNVPRAWFPEHDTDVLYGLGWHLNHYRGHRQIWHGGNLGGYSSIICLFPDADLGITVLTNLGFTHAPTATCRIIADAVLFPDRAPIPWIQKFIDINGIEPPSCNPTRVLGTKPSKPLLAYTGSYVHPAYGTVKVSLGQEKDTLACRFLVKGLSRTATHWHYDAFMGVVDGDGMGPEGLLAFELDVAGDVSAFRDMGLEEAIPDGIRFVKQNR
ncbi:hypothetical protein HKX48_000505 [Thoreauomyces humboldtii]|nr:hypothetical protein HKX48_000505 [Thoreauomyces humboldtii]